MKIVFDQIVQFEACRAAEAWCGDRGIAVGRMERGQPRGLLRGPYDIAKWHNLSGPERRELDGTMTGDMRHGPVVIELKGEEADYPLISEEAHDD
ncbi:hypothetical protein [Paraburkholderia tuberum]|uniref:Uncharacterized protein n=1 Tax=Paraburkholderia tuberum TaxID=157910 RepID=A0A1H1JT40_9BURK|nr:hypothetical protein [Paraburkholderia tuberum]SDR52677.1 hypothetical protein SAMN05445850_5521 [Paraburkholderia tuberum]